MTAAEQQSYTLLACLAFHLECDLEVETMVMVEVMMKVVDEEVDEEQLGCRG